MENQIKKDKLRSLVMEMLDCSHQAAVLKAERALRSTAVNVDDWDEKMVLPKCIVTAALELEVNQYNGTGTCFEKQVKEKVINIRHGILTTPHV